MKKKNLEILLQKIPPFPNPKPELEQYITPASIVADITFLAYHDIKNKTVIDLGCGTGIFSIAAALANAKKVTGIDIDPQAIEIAKKQSQKFKLSITFQTKDISEVDMKCDTVLMNPPFGAQKYNLKMDRKFIEKAFEISKIFYSLHLTKTMSFIKKMIKSLNGKIVLTKQYQFPIKATYTFHKKEKKKFKTTLIKVIT